MAFLRHESSTIGEREWPGLRRLWPCGLALLALAACAASGPGASSVDRPPPSAPEPIATTRPEPASPAASAPQPGQGRAGDCAQGRECEDATATSAPRSSGSATPGEAPASASATAAAPVASGPDDVEGANMRVGGMTVDGIKLSDVLCRSEGGAVGGLFGGLTVGAGFKARKAALDACSPKGQVETRVRWTSTGGRMTGVKASGASEAVSRCVERALTGAPALAGVCAATVRHGRP